MLNLLAMINLGLVKTRRRTLTQRYRESIGETLTRRVRYERSFEPRPDYCEDPAHPCGWAPCLFDERET